MGFFQSFLFQNRPKASYVPKRLALLTGRLVSCIARLALIWRIANKYFKCGIRNSKQREPNGFIFNNVTCRWIFCEGKNSRSSTSRTSIWVASIIAALLSFEAEIWDKWSVTFAAASFDHLITNQRVFTNDSVWESAKRGSWKTKFVTKHALFFREKKLQTFRSQALFMALIMVVVFTRQL